MEFDLIAAVDTQWGLSKNNIIPWAGTLAGHEDISWFRAKTLSCAIIMGRKTWDSLPQVFRPLPNRINVVISSAHTGIVIMGGHTSSPVVNVNSFEAALDWCACSPRNSMNKPYKCIVIGGADIYQLAIVHPHLRHAYITTIKGDFECDLRFPAEYLLNIPYTYDNKNVLYNLYRQYDFTNNDEYKYLALLKELTTAQIKNNRTDVQAASLSHKFMTFNLYEPGRGMIVPLLTTKLVRWRLIYHELIWFLRGGTTTKYLQDHKVHIWDGNSSREFLDSRGLNDYAPGEVGPIYGAQWRKWNAPYGTTNESDTLGQNIDQLANVIETLKADPTDRRMVVSAWNPAQINQMALPPCHYSFQFNVDTDEYGNNKFLNCIVNMRSVDVFCGLPFNCVSYALLTHIVAHIVGLVPGKLSFSMCDAHLYLNAMDQAKLQLTRRPKRFPVLEFSQRILSSPGLNIDDFAYKFTLGDYIITDYLPDAPIKVDMVV